MYVSTVVKNTMLETGGCRDAVFGTLYACASLVKTREGMTSTSIRVD